MRFPRLFRSDTAPVTAATPSLSPKAAALVAAETRARKDGWYNPVTNVGGTALQTMTSFQWDYLLCDGELQALYHNSDIARRIIDARPKAMFRKGYKIQLKAQDAGDADKLNQVKKRAKELGVNAQMANGIRWGKLYGGAVALMNFDDLKNIALPLDPDAPAKLNSITVLDRRYVCPLTYYSDPFKPKYGQVETYMITAQQYPAKTSVTQRTGSVVHETRVVRFEGDTCDQQIRGLLQGWTTSALQAPYDAMQKFANAFDCAAIMLNDASTNVFTVNGLMEAIGSGATTAVQTRMAVLNEGRSAARAMVIDEGETFEKIQTVFQDIPDVMDRFMMRLAAAADVPVTILMGRSPAGENATGESDFRAFYDSIGSEQTDVLLPIMERVYGFLMRECGLGDRDFEIEFLPLWEPTAKEWAEIRKLQAETDQIYITTGVLYASEIAISRFGDGKWSPETEIDVVERKKDLDAEKAMGSPGDVQTAKAVALKPEPTDPTDPEDPEPSAPGGGSDA